MLGKFKNIFFDFDGVLAESVQVKAEAFYSLYEPYGHKVANKVKQHHYENGGVSRFEKIAFCHKEYLGLILSKEEILVKAQEFSNLVLQGVINSPEVSGAHLFLKKHVSRLKFWIITGTPTSEIKTIVESRNMTSYFMDMYGSPETKTYWANYIISKHHLDASESLFIGDAVQDQQAAQNTGLTFILRDTPDNKNCFREYSGLRLNDLTELEDIILTL